MKRSVLAILIVTLLLSVGIGVGSMNGVKARAEGESQATEIDKVLINPNSAANGLYLEFNSNKQKVDTGYTEWTNMDEPVTAFAEQIMYNDAKFSEAGNVQGIDTPSTLYFSVKGSSFVTGDELVIPQDATYTNGSISWRFTKTFTVTYDGSQFLVSESGGSQTEFAYYEVDSVTLHANSTVSGMYIMFETIDGAAADTGYTNWTPADDATKALQVKMTLNGKSLAEVEGAVLQGMDIANALSLSGFTLAAGDEIVIPEGAKLENGNTTLEFMRTFTITWDGSAFTVERTDRVIEVPDYDMPEGMLSDFTKNAAIRLAGMSYQEAAVNNAGGGWNTDYEASKLSGRYITADEASEGSTNGGYEVSWGDDIQGLLHPSVMFSFPQEVAFDTSDDLVFRIWFSEDLDMSFVLWITSSLTPNVWDAQTMVNGTSFKAEQWNEISVSAADYVDENGKIAPIAFTLNYDLVYGPSDLVGSGRVVFDTANFVQVPKVLADEYTVNDISELVPVGTEKSFTGTRTEVNPDFDYSVDENIAFARTDKRITGVVMNMTINNMSEFSFYFVLNGTSKYFNQGGAYYWFSDEGINVGYSGNSSEVFPWPAGVTAGTAFKLELDAIPYYVNGLQAGYFAQVKINDQVVGEGEYIASAACNFGNWFGLYLHNSTKDVTVTLQPVKAAEEAAVTLELSASLNATRVGVGESLGLCVEQFGQFYDEGNITYEIVSGEDCAQVDENGFVKGLKDGSVTIRAAITNAFGTFYSNELTLQVGNGAQSGGGGCRGSVGFGGFLGGAGGLVALAVCTVAVLKKKN